MFDSFEIGDVLEKMDWSLSVHGHNLQISGINVCERIVQT